MNELSVGLNTPTPVETIELFSKRYLLKRDDLIHPDFSGNKARKFFSLLRSDLSGIRKVVSYGSNQSNAMYSLSVLARMKGWEFEYHVDHIPSYLKNNPIGNYRAALKNGAVFIEDGLKERVEFAEDTLFVEEGGRQKESEYGIAMLAREISRWRTEHGVEKLSVFLPSGTGTTALYLRKHFFVTDDPISVYTTPCVGDSSYLRRQFSLLEPDSRYWPRIVDLSKKYHFGKLYREFYEIWIELRKECGVEFDMLYDPKGWMVLRDLTEEIDGEILYIHQGGIMGNESMLERYRRKYPSL